MARASITWAPLTLIALACTMTGPVQAEEGMFMKNMLTNLGIIDDEKAAASINYRERAPLAVPPKLDLPQPSAGPGAREAAWPNDTDVVKRKRAVAERQQPVPFPSDNRPSQGAVMKPDELNRTPKRTAKGDQPGPREVYGDGRLSTWVDPDELKKGTETTDPSKLAYGQEPERGTLLQPPSGYRMPAGNAPLASTKSEPVGVVNRDNRPERDWLGRSNDD
ncbi:hypothetical protein [Chelatococcus reniformis]|uniref:Uncharacterized protein n=1 Tax=Chelatococcus reniformis TaxID=1494448 RepID=A0A916UB91_9HYPH|nr:hypothetical protein [Chelatococcus reniformis]GGC67347.1 hypothetical protein GCM10010994_27430 [Chelatococcus reniformis]